jgi:Beta/Gamma crystallin/Peptidase inhibitor family I36
MRNSIAVIAWMGLAAAFMSQQVRSEDGIRDRVCVYEHADYGGYEQCFASGASINSLGRFSNRISSVRILGRGSITLYEHPNFQGRELAISSDVADLRRFGYWNDEADSVRVSFGGGRSRDRRDDWRDDRRDSYGEDRVCFYEHSDFAGASQCWDAGDDVSDLRSNRWNDRISSVRIFGRTRVAVFEHINYGGQRLVLDDDISNLKQLGFNDRVSSFRVSGGGRERRY